MHTGKDGKTQRGHSRNEDPLDTQILLERPEDAPAGVVQFEMRFTKCRHSGGKLEELEGRIWTLTGSNWTAAVSGQDVGIMEYLQEGKSVRWIKDELGIGHGRIKKIRAKMVADGLLQLNAKADGLPTPNK